jgi:glycosyltransferase involved in cell wall biosynthesis
MERVSIIIPIYNAEKDLAFCLNSVLNQTYQELEIILVDDGSSDTSSMICDEYAKRDPRIMVYHRSNKGVSAARNYGIEKATGMFLLFVDADDTIEPEMVEGCMQLANSHQADLVICSFRYHKIDDHCLVENSLGSHYSGSAKELFQNWFSVLMEKELLNPPWNKLIKRELLMWSQIRFHEKFSICEDRAFSIQIIAASRKTVLTDKIYYNYYLKKAGTLVFQFHENYYEALSYFYDLAYTYCVSFNDHENQLRCLNTLYVNLSIMFVKQICTMSNWSKEKKYRKMREIASDARFQAARNRSNIRYKKKLISILLQTRRYHLIQFLYTHISA